MDTINNGESLKTLFYISTVVLSIAVIVIGYFMSRRDLSITTATDNLTAAVQQLKIVVTTLQIQYDIKQPQVDKQLEMLRLSQLELNERLNHLEVDHAVFHCNYKPTTPVPKPKSRKTNENNTY
ncbi:MAG: hypothetical protein LC658_16145 [Bacteroidales bacterium]|nr:hypothetical protein [Bacteroidales bacterium]